VQVFQDVGDLAKKKDIQVYEPSQDFSGMPTWSPDLSRLIGPKKV
jgi:hypothetical protein